jgi:predicted RNA methylase
MWYLPILLVIVLILAISITWTNLRGAPWVPTPMSMVHKMLKMAEVGPDDIVYDLGCGDGRIIVTAARRYGARAVGFEIDPLRYLWCQLLITVLRLRGRVKIVFGDFFSQDLSAADVVTCYLLQGTNKKLLGKLKEQLKPGSRVVSYYFTFPGLQLVRQNEEDKLYMYILGLSPL